MWRNTRPRWWWIVLLVELIRLRKGGCCSVLERFGVQWYSLIRIFLVEYLVNIKYSSYRGYRDSEILIQGCTNIPNRFLILKVIPQSIPLILHWRFLGRATEKECHSNNYKKRIYIENWSRDMNLWTFDLWDLEIQRFNRKFLETNIHVYLYIKVCTRARINHTCTNDISSEEKWRKYGWARFFINISWAFSPWIPQKLTIYILQLNTSLFMNEIYNTLSMNNKPH